MLIGHHLNIKLNRDLQIWAPRNVIRNSWSILENNRLLRRPDLENGRPRTVSDHYHSFNLIMHSILNRQVPRWVSISLVRKGGLELLQAHLTIPGKTGFCPFKCGILRQESPAFISIQRKKKNILPDVRRINMMSEAFWLNVQHLGLD